MSADVPRVYIETTVVSYLTSRPNRDIIIAAHQEMTRQWWEKERQQFELYISPAVLKEASRGDPAAAQDRIDALADIPILEATENVTRLAEELLRTKAIPSKAAEDAFHIAVAAAWEIPFLLTWNMRHLVNPLAQPRIQTACLSLGFQSPLICTPELLRRAVT